MASDITEDDIDNLSMPKAVKLMIKHKITDVNESELKSLRFSLKGKLLCGEESRTNAANYLERERHDDTILKGNLFTLYDEIIDFAKLLRNQKGVELVTSELDDEFPDICSKLESSKQSIKDSSPHVLVLGESGSGKSSFINLFLGETYFPISVLSNTHVICEIRYAEETRAELYKPDGNMRTLDISKGKEPFMKDLQESIQKIEYKLAKVYLPCEVLKCGLVIVDSPGIGESEDMANMTLDYIVNAAVFMYVIDSTNAGGMLSRVQELVQKVNKKILEEQKGYRPDSALFICNKWDEIPKDDKDKVVQDTRKNIKKCWQDCDDKQIIWTSTQEAEFIQRNYHKISPKFELILKSMSELIDVGRKIVVLKGYSFMCKYVDRCVNRFMTVLSRLDTTVEIRQMRYTSTKERLQQLETNIETFFKEQDKKIVIEQDLIAKHLEEYVNMKDNRDEICRFTSRELPESTTWDQAAIEVRIKVYKSIQSLISDWEAGKELYKSLAKDIQEALEVECPRFERDIYIEEKGMEGVHPNEPDTSDDIDFLPNSLWRKISGLSTGSKVALGVGLSPVILVGLIIRVPVLGVQAIYKSVTNLALDKEFKAAKGDREKMKQVCEKYARKMVGDITEKFNLNAVIVENLQPLRNYLQQQKLKMLNQIEMDRKFLKRLIKEKMNDEDVRRSYKPLRDKSCDIQKHLKCVEKWLFKRELLPENTCKVANVS